jgi:hypothetical protein
MHALSDNPLIACQVALSCESRRLFLASITQTAILIKGEATLLTDLFTDILDFFLTLKT